MTTRGQNLRSSTPGNMPAAGTRQPGEIWMTFPDKQFGIIDATKTAQPMIAVRFFSTQANYATNDIVVQAGAIYIAKGAVTAGAFVPANWSKLAQLTDIPVVYVLPTASTSVLGGVKIDGSSITINSGVISSTPTSTYVLPPASTTVLGGVKVDGATIKAAGDGTISTTVVPLGDNRIINGDMRIDQRNNGASGTAVGYTVDRWQYIAAQTGKGTWQRGTGTVVLLGLGFGYYLNFLSSSAYTPVASDYFGLKQTIEADVVGDFAWGTANAQPVTLSFLVYSSLTGAFSGSIEGATPTRSYPFTFNIPTANTWTKVAINIPGDTAGTWTLQGNAAGVLVTFDLGSGSNFRGPANAWASGNIIGVTGSVSIVGTNAATFNITGVKLEIGSVATPYNRQSLAKSMADCQRYYQTIGNHILAVGYNAAGQSALTPMPLPVVMRAAPTVVYSATSYGNASNLVSNATTQNMITNQCTITATGSGYAIGLASMSAEL